MIIRATKCHFIFGIFRYAHRVFIMNARKGKWGGRNFDQSHLKQNESLLFPLLWGQDVKLALEARFCRKIARIYSSWISETKKKRKNLKEMFACLYIM